MKDLYLMNITAKARKENVPGFIRRLEGEFLSYNPNTDSFPYIALTPIRGGKEFGAIEGEEAKKVYWHGL